MRAGHIDVVGMTVPRTATGTMAASCAAAADLKLTWSDCGAGKTHAKIFSFSPDALLLGQKTTMTGIVALEAVSGVTFDLKVTGSIGTLVDCFVGNLATRL